jgi:N-acetylmuramoyl-L-alanine amidase
VSDSDVLKRANSFMKSTNKSDQFRAYNDYKNLYLRSIMNEDSKLKLNSLKGIVKSGKYLHIDISQYENELLKMKKTANSSPKNSQKEKNKKVNSSNKLESVEWDENTLTLHFNKKLSSKQLNYFKLYDRKTKRYKYIFDIHASILKKSYNLQKDNITRVKLAQHNTSTLRLVLENRTKLDISFKQRSEDVIISVNSKSLKNSAINKKSKETTPKRLDRNKVIVLDPGHGGRDPGAVGYKRYREKKVVMQIAQKLKNILKARGYKVYMTREKDKLVKLSKRTKYANKKNGDIFISIHANAVPERTAKKTHGIETFFLSKSRTSRAKRVAEKENSADLSDMNFYGKQSFLNTLSSHNIVASNKLAIDLQRGMLGSLQQSYKNVHDGGVREGPFWVLVGAQMPSVLVEVGFITHPTEAKRLVNSKYQKKLAMGMANGIERYFLNN